MKRISNMFKSKATKEREKREEEQQENNRRIIQQNNEYWRKAQAAADIKTLEQSGNYTPEKINKYRNPENWSDLNDLATMLRRSVGDRKAIESEKKMDTLFKNIQKQNTELQRKVNVSKTYLKSLGGTNAYIPTHWKNEDLFHQADITYRLRRLSDELDHRDTAWQMGMLPPVPTNVTGTRKGGKLRQNKKKSRKTGKGKKTRKGNKSKRRKNRRTRK